MSDLDGILAVSNMNEQEIEKEMASINGRYKRVVDILPPTSDRDYFQAKKALARKTSFKEGLEARK
jgi:hypothetical protein